MNRIITMMIAAIYARKSTEQNGVADDAKSVARQVEHARAYASRKGWIVAGRARLSRRRRHQWRPNARIRVKVSSSSAAMAWSPARVGNAWVAARP